MGFEKRYLPGLEELKEEYQTLGHDEFVRRIVRYDAIIGPHESQLFIESVLAQSNAKKTNDQCITSPK